MVMQRWEPFGDIVSLRDAMDRLFEQSVVRPPRGTASTGLAGARMMPINVFQKDSEYVIQAYLPGVNAQDVEIGAERDSVTIKAHIPGAAEKEEAKSYKWLASELAHGDVVRMVTLPTPIDSARIDAEVENGVLSVVVPQAEEAKPKKITVKSK